MFDELFRLVAAKVHSLKKARTGHIHSSLLIDQRVRDILEITLPRIEDISEILGTRKRAGRVLAVRLDTAYGITGFKKPVIASLILKRLIEAAKKDQYNKKWIDGGNLQYIHDTSNKAVRLIGCTRSRSRN